MLRTLNSSHFQVILALELQGGGLCCFPEQDDEGQKKVEELFMKLVCGYWGRDSCEWWLTDPVFGTALAGVRACSSRVT